MWLLGHKIRKSNPKDGTKFLELSNKKERENRGRESE